MLKFLKKELKPNQNENNDCSCNIISLANFFFKGNPSFKEISICPSGCSSRITEQHVALGGSKCRQGNCNSFNTNSIHEIGNIIMIGVDTDFPMEISTIPTTFKSPKNGDIYALMGFVDFVGPPVTTRNTNLICHYRAFFRKKAHWTVYDDLQKKTI
ncbi:hypothetical protein M5D96_012676 [Drosophila gunungcola]|uniref:Uncharacterized protein n=1 Tax=Drosophila gunungcola TaxID=103775 RepID=A0A9Q0BJ94_9MUSC|nr:hypothetical protein M5D96_012676 [Drosophila gunungcola]